MTMSQVIIISVCATSLFFLLVLWIALGVESVKEKRRKQREYFMEQLMRVSSETERVSETQNDISQRLDIHADILNDLMNEMEELKNAKKKSNRQNRNR